MNRELAKELKIAGFPVTSCRVGHRFYPPETATQWDEETRKHGVTVTKYELDNHLEDIKSGYYCPNLSDLIEACGDKFARLFVLKAIWMAESDGPAQTAIGDTPEEAVARLWLALNRLRSVDIGPSTPVR